MDLVIGLILIACTVVVIGVIIRIWAAVLRMSVRMTNGVLGGRDIDEADYRRGGGYNYDPIPRPKSLAGLRVPVPGVLYAILINIGQYVASLVAQTGVVFVGGVLAGVAAAGPVDPARPESMGLFLGVIAAALLANVLASVLVLKLALPTTFLRALVVWVCQGVISLLLIAAVVVGLVAAFGLSMSDLPVPQSQGNTVWFK
ncbi:MAG TPA: hypothetical protein VH092_11425 [Urbifossiella sp.]|nr:hypothetical protein [Urbifossiella sp.]